MPRRAQDDENDFDHDDYERPVRKKRRARQSKSSSGQNVAVIVIGILGGVMLLCGGLFAAVYFMAVKPAANQLNPNTDSATTFNTTQQNYIMISKAAHTQLLDEGHFPTPYHSVSTEHLPKAIPSNLSQRLSWRVSQLSYLSEKDLFQRFDLKQPWDGMTNKPLSEISVICYADAETPSDPTTRIRCFYDNGALFDSDPSKKAKISAITDGLSNTLLYVESADKVIWTQFNDLKYDAIGPLPALGHPTRSTFLVVMGDGSVRNVRKSVSPEHLRAVITKAGGEVNASQKFN